MIEQVSRREFDNLNLKVEKQGEKLSLTACDIREIKTNQCNDSEKLDKIADNVDKIFTSMEKRITCMSKDVSINKIQIAKIVALGVPVNSFIAYFVTHIVK